MAGLALASMWDLPGSRWSLLCQDLKNSRIFGEHLLPLVGLELRWAGVDTQASLGGNAACRSAACKGPLLGTFPQAGRAPGKPGFLQTPSERSLPWCILHLYNKS